MIKIIIIAIPLVTTIVLMVQSARFHLNGGYMKDASNDWNIRYFCGI